jgi:hypothetical protein
VAGQPAAEAEQLSCLTEEPAPRLIQIGRVLSTIPRYAARLAADAGVLCVRRRCTIMQAHQPLVGSDLGLRTAAGRAKTSCFLRPPRCVFSGAAIRRGRLKRRPGGAGALSRSKTGLGGCLTNDLLNIEPQRALDDSNLRFGPGHYALYPAFRSVLQPEAPFRGD